MQSFQQGLCSNLKPEQAAKPKENAHSRLALQGGFLYEQRGFIDKLQKYAKAFFLFDCSSHSPRLWYRVAICAAGLVVSLILTLRHSPLCFVLYGLVFFFYLFVFRKQSKRYQKAVKTATLEECLRPFLKNISYLEKDGLDPKAILNAGNIRKSAIFSGLQMPRIRACKL